MTADPTAFVLGGRGGLRRRDLRALRTWAGLAVVAVLVVIPLRGLYRFTGGTMEEGFMLYFPERMAKGDVPNVDFLHLYGPGSLHVLMAWYELFGHTLAVERTFGLLQHVAIILALFFHPPSTLDETTPHGEGSARNAVRGAMMTQLAVRCVVSGAGVT